MVPNVGSRYVVCSRCLGHSEGCLHYSLKTEKELYVWNLEIITPRCLGSGRIYKSIFGSFHAKF